MLESNIKAVSKEYDLLKISIDGLTKENVLLKNDIKDLNKENDVLKIDADQLMKENLIIKNNSNALHDENEQLKDCVKEVEKENEELKIITRNQSSFMSGSKQNEDPGLLIQNENKMYVSSISGRGDSRNNIKSVYNVDLERYSRLNKPVNKIPGVIIKK